MSASPWPPPGAARRTATIVNEKGLHARAAALFAKTAAAFDAEVRVSSGGATVSGLSIMGLMMLAAGPGAEIEITAGGPAAEEAVAALLALVAARFGEN